MLYSWESKFRDIEMKEKQKIDGREIVSETFL
jgi:hypothetical protein